MQLYLSVSSTISLLSFHFSSFFFFYSWDSMALVTKMGGFYRRIEKGIHFFFFVLFFAILTIVFVLGGCFFPRLVVFLFCFAFMHALAFCVCYYHLTTPPASLPPLPYHYTFLFLSFSVALSLSLFFVVFEMMGFAVGCFLFLSTG